MKIRKIFTGGLVTTLIVVLTACGVGETTEKNAENVPPIETAIEVTEEASDEAATAITTEKAAEETLTEEEKTVETAETTDESASEENVVSNVVNNNGHFVQVGDKIYFHIADADSLGKTALWAQFADQQSGRTVLFEYDPAKDEAKDIAFDFTSGGISVQGGVLYSLAYKDNLEQPDEPEVALGSYKQKDGFKTLDLAKPSDTLLGAGLNDSFLAVLHYDYVENTAIYQILIYKDGVLQKTIDVDQYGECIALGEHTIFYFSGEPETGYNVKQLDVITGETIDLGRLPSFEFTDWNGHIDEAIFDGTQIYFTYSTYEGTGHFFSQGFFVQAKVGEGNSLRYEDMPNRIEDGEPRVAKFAVEDGQMIVSEGEPGTCEVKGDGVLGYYDEMGEWVEVAEDWGTVFLDADGTYKGVELAEKVGDSIFLIYSENQRAPEDDIGWRYAYCRNYTNVYRISVETGESTRLVHQAAPWSD